MNNLFKKLFTKQQETTPCKALLELDAIRDRNEKRMEKIKESMGDLYILHPSHKKSKLNEPTFCFGLALDKWVPITKEQFDKLDPMIRCVTTINPDAAPVSVKREWVDLTDDEFQKIKNSLSRQHGWDGDGWDLALKKAVSAAFKEKNK